MAAEAGAETRARAARAVAAVAAGRSLDTALERERPGLAEADRALLAALAFGVIRDRRLLETLAAGLWQRRPAPPLQALILVGLHQLRAMRMPARAAVHATVAAAGLLGHPRAGGLVNAVLRRYQRESAALEAGVPAGPALRCSHPDWLVERLRRDWPQHWRELLTANNRPAPMTLRVNTRRGSRAAYRQQLAAAGIDAAPHPHAPAALLLAQPRPVAALPGFQEGRASVQDAAAQLAAPLLELAPGLRVLDACAAPGGKTAHCLELADCEVTALDVDAERLTRVRETLTRLGLAAPSGTASRGQRGLRLIAADALKPQDWWDGRPFDRILIDAPCTGSGVIRRHPDIKWLRRPADAAALATRQRALMDALWPLLAPGGLLLYATCSVLRAEGTGVVDVFLAHRADAAEYPIKTVWGEPQTHGRRIASGEADMDGFYYARLRRVV